MLKIEHFATPSAKTTQTKIIEMSALEVSVAILACFQNAFCYVFCCKCIDCTGLEDQQVTAPATNTVMPIPTIKIIATPAHNSP